jgi:hypothetical protein
MRNDQCESGDSAPIAYSVFANHGHSANLTFARITSYQVVPAQDVYHWKRIGASRWLAVSS